MPPWPRRRRFPGPRRRRARASCRRGPPSPPRRRPPCRRCRPRRPRRRRRTCSARRRCLASAVFRGKGSGALTLPGDRLYTGGPRRKTAWAHRTDPSR
ncbi:hypothetical protein E2C06_02785 [Dankookia rubra]|uniref:Uncharacterized protein n=1 Tax=Dankookia rubra TaxID=1442381 RepID=A0A4R5QL95_9PROT|nr:hypothetical protein E2C06_02785 [Dankookia rubra]